MAEEEEEEEGEWLKCDVVSSPIYYVVLCLVYTVSNLFPQAGCDYVARLPGTLASHKSDKHRSDGLAQARWDEI